MSIMSVSQEERVRQAFAIAHEIIEHNYSVHRIEKDLGISHSTAHKRIVVTLKSIDEELFDKCDKVFKQHKKDAMSNAREHLAVMRELKKNKKFQKF